MTVGPIDYTYIGFHPDFEDELLELINQDRIEGGLPPFKADPELKDYARQSLTEKKEVLPPGRTSNLLFFNYNRGPEETADYLPWKTDIFSLKHEDGSPYYLYRHCLLLSFHLPGISLQHLWGDRDSQISAMVFHPGYGLGVW